MYLSFCFLSKIGNNELNNIQKYSVMFLIDDLGLIYFVKKRQ